MLNKTSYISPLQVAPNDELVKQGEQLYWPSIFKETKLCTELAKLILKIHKYTKYLINLNKNTLPSKVKANKQTNKFDFN